MSPNMASGIYTACNYSEQLFCSCKQEPCVKLMWMDPVRSPMMHFVQVTPLVTQKKAQAHLDSGLCIHMSANEA